jgi:aminodeoxyfutalosine synthase
MLKIGVPTTLKEIREKVIAGERLSFEDGLRLFESNDLAEIGRLANLVRERLHGDKAYFSHKYRLYPTNLCMYRCRFCAFRVSKGDAQGYEWPAEKTLHELSKVDLSGVTEFHIVGGVHPDWGFDVYLDIVRELHKCTWSGRS